MKFCNCSVFVIVIDLPATLRTFEPGFIKGNKNSAKRLLY